VPRKKKQMTVAELIAKLEQFDENLPINVFRASGDYGTPAPTLVIDTLGKPQRVAIPAEEDD
jgi:hypothetical protein